MKKIDLRSDTVTVPTQEMREAMASAEVGDDVYGEDPTVNKLEEVAAEKVGKEAGLFVTSGTQGNLIALLAHCSKGDGAILGADCHIYNYEGGGIAAIAGVLPLLVDDTGGIMSKESVKKWCRPHNVHFAPARLLCLENTHNRQGGNAVSPSVFREVAEAAKAEGLSVHLDGARIFNAAVAWGVDVKEYTTAVDTVQLCLSKGLGAPVGSVLCGPKDFIEKARHWRKRLGGGMRQAGVIAACGLIAVEKMVDRLEEDHKNAALLAELLEEGGLHVEKPDKRTNMVYFVVKGEESKVEELTKRCAARGVLFNALSKGRFRLVTHLWVTEKDVREAAKIIIEEAAAC
jgi:threonine aldolase